MATSSTWVAQIDLMEGPQIRSIRRVPDDNDSMARVWVRRAGVPLGHVEVAIITGKPDLAVLRRLVTLKFGTDPGELQLGEDGLGQRSSDSSREDGHAWEPISVVIATKGRPDLFREALASLRALRYPEFEVIVVDGSLDDATAAVFEDLVGGQDSFRYIAEPRPGLSLARNCGMAVARHALVAFTDDDCRADPFWLYGIATGFQRDSEVACVTGMVPASDLQTPSQQYFDRRVWWSTVLTPRIYRPEAGPDDSPLHPFRVGIYGTGANFAVRRDVALRLGGFSELLGAGSPCRGGGEDGDMFVRILMAGSKLAYEPSAIIWHEGRASQRDLEAQLREYGRGMLVTGLKWLMDPSMRAEVLRRMPRASVHYLALLAKRGRAEGSGSGSMAWAEAAAIPGGAVAFVTGYRAWRRSGSSLRSTGEPRAA